MKELDKEFLITLFLGIFGVHKFMKGDKKTGIIYLLTFGLFGIGWIIDIVKIGVKASNEWTNNINNTNNLKMNNPDEIPNIQVTNLNLGLDETCCYMGKACTFSDKNFIEGYIGQKKGMTIRIAKGLSYHTGGGSSKAIHKVERKMYNGILYITNKRVIFTSQKDSFDKTFDKITSILEAKDGLIIQIGSKTYSIITKNHSEFMRIFNLVKNLENKKMEIKVD